MDKRCRGVFHLSGLNRVLSQRHKGQRSFETALALMASCHEMRLHGFQGTVPHVCNSWSGRVGI